MSTDVEPLPGRERFIVLRIFAAFFFFATLKNLTDIVLDEYYFEWILLIKYFGLMTACSALFFGYRLGYFLFLATVAFTLASFAIVDPAVHPIQYIFALIGPTILSACVIPKWKQLRGWPSRTQGHTHSREK